jgi:hypothetical protein
MGFGTTRLENCLDVGSPEPEVGRAGVERKFAVFAAVTCRRPVRCCSLVPKHRHPAG